MRKTAVVKYQLTLPNPVCCKGGQEKECAVVKYQLALPKTKHNSNSAKDKRKITAVVKYQLTLSFTR